LKAQASLRTPPCDRQTFRPQRRQLFNKRKRDLNRREQR
jgi:hypothetical protein